MTRYFVISCQYVRYSTSNIHYLLSIVSVRNKIRISVRLSFIFILIPPIIIVSIPTFNLPHTAIDFRCLNDSPYVILIISSASNRTTSTTFDPTIPSSSFIYTTGGKIHPYPYTIHHIPYPLFSLLYLYPT